MKALIDGAYGHRNLGDELILKSLLLSLSPKVSEFTVLSADPQETSTRHSVRALSRSTHYASRRRFSSLLSICKVVRELTRTDVYIIGGGSLITDERGALPLVRYVLLAMGARALRKRVLLLGIGVGPLESRSGRRIARVLLRLATVVAVRDRSSAELVRGLSGKVSVTESADLVFSLSPDVSKGDAGALGVSVRDIPPSRYYPDRNAVRRRMVDNLSHALDRFIDETGRPVVFVPFQFLEGGDERLDDVAVSRLVIEGMSNKSQAEIAASDEFSIADTYGRLGMMLGERYHSLVCAMLFAKPFFAIDYHEKVRALLRDAGLESLGLPLDPTDENHGEALGASIIEAWDRREELGSAVAGLADDLRARARIGIKAALATMNGA